MSNNLPDTVVQDIRSLATQGMGIRAIARAIGISPVTVKRHYPYADNPKCKCGKPAQHNGWCKHRYSQSVARQAFHSARRGVNIIVPPPIRASRQSAKRARIMRWLGQAVSFTPVPLSYLDMYGIIGEVRTLCKRFPVLVREDVEQEVILRTCAGLIFRPEIPAAVKWFFGYFWRLTSSISIDGLLGWAPDISEPEVDLVELFAT